MRLSAFSILALSLTLASCIPGGKKSGSQTDRYGGYSTRDAQKCLKNLKSERIRFQPLANKNYGGGCKAHNAVRLLDMGIPATNLGPMTCSLAGSFAEWSREIVRPAARRYLGSPIARIETSGTYSCRRVSGSGRLSQHAHANAVDVFAFRLENGRRITVLDGWNGRRDEQRFLRAIHADACGLFGTVLGPKFDRQHRNHFHLDMSPSRVAGNAFCR